MKAAMSSSSKSDDPKAATSTSENIFDGIEISVLFDFGVGDQFAKAAFDLRTASGVFVSDGEGGVTGVDE